MLVDAKGADPTDPVGIIDEGCSTAAQAVSEPTANSVAIEPSSDRAGLPGGPPRPRHAR